MAFKKILKSFKDVKSPPPPEPPVHEVKKDAWMENNIEKGLENSLKTSDHDNLSTIAIALKAYQFVDNMTMHGVRYIFAKDMNVVRRLFWICAVFGVMGYCTFLIYETITAYFLYSTTIYLSTTFESKSQFPAITICNFNAFQKSYMTRREVAVVNIVYGQKYGLGQLNQFVDYEDILSGDYYISPTRINSSDLSGSDLTNLTNNLGNEDGFGTLNGSLSNQTGGENDPGLNLSTPNLLDLLSNGNVDNSTAEDDSYDQEYEDDQNDTINSTNLFRQYFGEEYESDAVSSLLHTINVTEFFHEKAFFYKLDVCRYKDKPCNKTHFTSVLTDFGVCLKFDPSQDPSAAHQTVVGPNGGLFFGAQFVEEDWTPGPNFNGQGFRIAIHPPGTTEYNLIDNGFSMRPQLTTEVTLTRREEIYLTSPHGQCGSRDLAYFSVYSKKTCIFECRTNHTVSLCGCKFVDMPGNAVVCSFAQYLDCVPRMSDDYEYSEEFEEFVNQLFDPTTCDCPQDCLITTYDTSVTHTDPASSFSQALKQFFGFDVESDAVTFQIFYREFQVSMQNEEPMYTVQKLFSEIGGAAGLFLGCSFLTFFEIIDFFIDILWFAITKRAFFTSNKLLDVENN